MTDLEIVLRDAYTAQQTPTPDVTSLVEGARRGGLRLRRRRRVLACAAAVVVVAAAAAGGQFFAQSAERHPTKTSATVGPTPAGPVLTVYRFAAATGGARIVSFIDTHGHWCIGAIPGGGERDSAYQCAGANLVPGTSGFGRVATRTDGFTYDGVNQWMQGVASADVTRVVVVMADRSTRTAHIVRGVSGVVFSVRLPWLATPAFYRAYDSQGRLVEELRVPMSLPHDPFVDWRLVPEGSSP